MKQFCPEEGDGTSVPYLLPSITLLESCIRLSSVISSTVHKMEKRRHKYHLKFFIQLHCNRCVVQNSITTENTILLSDFNIKVKEIDYYNRIGQLPKYTV